MGAPLSLCPVLCYVLWRRLRRWSSFPRGTNGHICKNAKRQYRVNLENRGNRRGRSIARDGQGLAWQPELVLGALLLNNFTKEWHWTRPTTVQSRIGGLQIWFLQDQAETSLVGRDLRFLSWEKVAREVTKEVITDREGMWGSVTGRGILQGGWSFPLTPEGG